ncbi:MAG: phosphoribosylformylglycinamidine synthase, partial [Clostridia bacterium]|nr:phosphoribosylformylglycinamidine synthase [Clostridia bacterium]
MIYRIYSEKFPELANEAKALRQELFRFLQIKGIDDLRILNRYDVEDIDEELFNRAKTTVFSEPQQDYIYDSLPVDTEAFVFAVEFLPGQFDQRADSAAQCIQLISQKDKPAVRTAKVYMIRGEISDEEKEAIKHYVINPVEAREASLELPDTLEMEYAVPTEVETVTGFTDMNGEELSEFIKKLGLAMDEGDIAFCQAYFRKEGRDPTITEIRMIDTYWSDHCRHTTFLTTIDDIRFEDEEIRKTYEEYLSVREELGIRKPVNLMDMGTIAAKYLKRKGLLDKLDESEEINACTVKINIEVNGRREDWLLLFKNETHNHPTEIEPFGGAATCIGGAIRDPLSGRSYVYAAMRITGASDPLQPVEKTIKGKLPQRKIVTTAAAGYSSYGNQIGLATGIVDELYHEGYTAKHMEIGAVLGAAPARNVRREVPLPGDVVILLGGRTGRDGIGGATGSSKSHTTQSLESCGAEVQKGNAPEERKLQRLFRNPEASRLIKRCNDFGAGGVSVAIGELADGLYIDLNAVPKKYEGLDGTELAISESQERMAVVVAPEDEMSFRELAFSENLEATKVAVVTEEPRLVMKWNGKAIVNISREFLNSNGAEKHIEVDVPSGQGLRREVKGRFDEAMAMMAGDLNICSKRGLSERFDSTIGAGTVLMPFGGSKQLTPIQTMIHKIPVESGDTNAVSFMSWGYNPYVMERSPYHGAYLSVVESVSKLIAAGADFKDIYLTFQEYFEKPMRDPKRWGKPAAALLGAFRAQMDLGIAAIGGKDSMSGTFENIDVPPTLVSFAVTT